MQRLFPSQAQASRPGAGDVYRHLAALFVVLAGIGGEGALARTAVSTPTVDLTCDDLLARLRDQPRDLMVGLAARSGPVYQDDRFQVHLDSKYLLFPTYSPARLKPRAIAVIKETLDTFAGLGFKPRSYVNVIVTSGAGKIQIKDGQRLAWSDDVITDAGVYLEDVEALGITGHLGRVQTVYPRPRPNWLRPEPAVIFGQLEGSPDHSLQSRFIVAHELAHATQPNGIGRLWEEARADLLAFLATGVSELDYGRKILMAIPDRAGERHDRLIRVLRSLREPTVAKVSDAIPLAEHHHFNSQIVSSALYALIPVVGRAAVVRLIKQIDRAPCAAEVFPAGRNVETTRQIIANHLRCHGLLIRRLLKAERLYDSGAAAVLMERELLLQQLGE